MQSESIPYSPGLEGVLAGETAISTVEDGLRYRGYAVSELAEHCSFDEVAFLLLYSELPKPTELREFQERIAAARRLPNALKDLLQAVPKWASPLEVLRTGVSVVAHFDQDTLDNSREANQRKAERLLAQLPVIIADRYHYALGEAAVLARPDLGHAANFLYMLRGSEPRAEETRALEVSLILYAEHEFNASTFTARTIVSTESDLHSAVVGAIGALKGRLHGGANERVMEILQAAGGPATAEAWVRDVLARKERIMGFGHRVYKSGDIRAVILKDYARRAAEALENTHWEQTADIIEQIVLSEKGLHPNLDWPAGRLYHSLGLEIPIYTPIFAMARVAGWAAHVIEQLDHNRLIRPRARYIGPAPRPVPPR